MHSDHADAIDGAQTIEHSGADSGEADVDPEDFIAGIESFDVSIDRALLNRFVVRRPSKDEIYFETKAQEQLYDILQDHVGKDNAIYSAELAEQVHPDDGDGQPQTREDLATLIKNGAPILASGNGYFIVDTIGEVADYGSGMISRIMGNLKRLESTIEATVETRAEQQSSAQANNESAAEPESEVDDQEQDPDQDPDREWSESHDIWGNDWCITVHAVGEEKDGNGPMGRVVNAVQDYLLGEMSSHSFEADNRPDSPDSIPDHGTDGYTERGMHYTNGETIVSLLLRAPEGSYDEELDTLVQRAERGVPSDWTMDDVVREVEHESGR